MFDALDTGASGLLAERTRLDTIAGNIANLNPTHNERGERVPYRRRFAVLASGREGAPARPGVHVESVRLDPSPFVPRYEPGNPDADANGYVQYPNIHMTVEYVNALEASRAYEANLNMMDVTKAMINA